MQATLGENIADGMDPRISLHEDTDYFLEMFWDNIDTAEHLICLTTYEMDHKLVSSITVNKLCKACERGVRVYMVIEDLNCYLDAKQEQQLKTAGAVVVKHYPMKHFFDHWTDGHWRRMWNRNHHKVMLIDNNIYTGSLNIAQRYTFRKYGSRSFRDLSIKLENYKAKYDTKEFILDSILMNKRYIEDFDEEDTRAVFKNIEEVFKKNDKELKNEDYDVTFLREQPPRYTQISESMVNLVKNSKKKIQIIQPYIQNIKELEDALEDALNRGVDVEIISARKRDQPIYASLLNSDLFSRMIKAGAKVYEEPYKYLHMKALSIDDKFLTLGSMNQDNTSFYENNEANILIEEKNPHDSSKGVFPSFEKVFTNLKEECNEVDPNERYTWTGGMKAFFWKRCLDLHGIITNNRKA
ncbi:unnamed protein product [Moneuplotes crassus]|uniref:PLD phosphodiesterase domain-containing protein n=1 Tax=Euplotes crassus TaxID=5936 RepID=A0AAD1XGW1_EUPCR|nr:unnamed protein product [Moneuplotes crassus]